MKLRPYQARALDRFTRSNRQSVLLVAPTGAGKGTMATHLMSSYAHRGLHVLFLVHRREIVHDIIARLHKRNVPVANTLYSDRPIRVVSVQSALRSHIRPVDLIIIDEAHHYAADEWKAVMERIDTKRVVGFTATPQRADGRSLGDMFDEIIDVVSYSDLIHGGHLTPCRVLRPKGSLEKNQIALSPAEAYLRYGKKEPALIFARRVREAEAIAFDLKLAGVRAESIDGRTRKGDRDTTMQRLKNRQLDVVVNVGILTEGADIPHVTTLVLARPCAHASTYVQIVGRVLRPSPGKEMATVIDLVGASFLHGLPNQDRIYTLEGPGMRQQERESRSGPSGDHLDVDLDVLGIDLVEIAPQTPVRPFAAEPRQPPPPPAPPRVLTPEEVAILEHRRNENERRARRQLLRELDEKTALEQGGERKSGTVFTKHGTTIGYIFEDKGFWNLGWRAHDKKQRFGLCTQDKAVAEEMHRLFLSHGIEAVRNAVRQRKRAGVTLFQRNESKLWSIRMWNEDKTKQVNVRLSTPCFDEACRVRDLFAEGKETRARQLIASYVKRAHGHYEGAAE